MLFMLTVSLLVHMLIVTIEKKKKIILFFVAFNSCAFFRRKQEPGYEAESGKSVMHCA